MTVSEFPVRLPSLQLGFYQRFLEMQRTHLLPALLEEIGKLEVARLDQELLEYAGPEKLSLVAQKGLRGELVFPVPYVLSSKPTLLGYYRLLLGFSQKEFYRKTVSRFKRMENEDVLTETTRALLPPLCRSLVESCWLLITGLPEFTQETIKALTLLTLGPQFRGSRNVDLGDAAITVVFNLIKAIVAAGIVEETPTCLVVKSAAGRVYRIEFAPDPDIAIRQVRADDTLRDRISIEVKGGTDFSNIHNRLGEAEKTHQKAKAEGFTQFWTVINVAGVKPSVWKKETPTTTELFYIGDIVDTEHLMHKRFKEYLESEIGM